MPEILPVTPHDVIGISSLAREIWFRQYQDILSVDQINYMLAQRYCPSVIHVQLGDEKIWWRKLVAEDGDIIGFSCCMRTPHPAELKIDKLYIQHDHHRKGYGRMLVSDAIRIMHAMKCSTLILTVNKQNYSAIHAYQCYGFKIMRDSVVDIGGGFFMNDYLMALTS